MADAPEPRDGELVILLVGDFDPPTMDYLRAASALRTRKDVGRVWACPLPPSDKGRARDLSMTFCVDSSQSGFPLTCCTVGIDRGLDEDGLLGWCRSHYPTLRFEVVGIMEDVRFAGEDGKGTRVPKHLRIGKGVVDRIRTGKDESRSFGPGTWSLIQARKYYR